MDAHADLEAVYARPDDDEPRAHLAAALMRSGDPRGEFISLQLAKTQRKLVAPERQRERDLLAAHHDVWLGALAPVLRRGTVRWERGFPSSGRLARPRRIEDVRGWIGLSPLSTLRSLDLDPFPEVRPAEIEEALLFGSPLRGLRRLKALERTLLPKLLVDPEPWALESIEVAPTGGGGKSGEAHEMVQAVAIAEAFAAARGTPALRSLLLSFAHSGPSRPERYAWLWTTTAGRRLRKLAMFEASYRLVVWREALLAAPRTDLEVIELHGISTLRLERGNGRWNRLGGALRRGDEDQGGRDLARTVAQLGPEVEVAVKGFEGRRAIGS